MAQKVVLGGACRTAIGKMGGALSNTPAADLGAIVIKEALRRANVKPEMVDEVKMGCVIQAAQGQNVARQAAIKAGLPIGVPAITINVVCGSGLKCVNDAATMIMAGEADIVVAGGMENMSMAPYAMTKARFGYRMNNATIIDTMVNDALTDAFNHHCCMFELILSFLPSFFLIHIFSILTKSVTKIHFSQTYRHYNRCHSHGATHASSIPSCFHWFCSSEYPFTSKY